MMTATGTTMGQNELFYIRAPIAKRAGRFSSGKTPTMMSQTTKREGLDELHLTEAFQPSRADCVEKMVAAAVLCQAAEDLQKFRHERRAAGQMLYNEVRDLGNCQRRRVAGLVPECLPCSPACASVRADRSLSRRHAFKCRGKDMSEPWVSDVPSMELRFFEMSGGKNLRKGQNTKPNTRA